MILKLSVIKILTDKGLVDRFLSMDNLSAVKKFGLSKLVRIFKQETDDLEDLRVNLVRKYGIQSTKEGAKEGDYVVPDENMDIFLKEMQTVLDKDIDITDFKFSPEDLDGFTIEEILLLGDLING